MIQPFHPECIAHAEERPNAVAAGVEPDDGRLKPCLSRASSCAYPHGSEILGSETVVFSAERSTTQ